jgi:hypothetical protein
VVNDELRKHITDLAVLKFYIAFILDKNSQIGPVHNGVHLLESLL